MTNVKNRGVRSIEPPGRLLAALRQAKKKTVPFSHNRRDLARTAFATLLTFGIVWMLHLSSWMQAGDDLLRSAYFRWGPQRSSAHRVIVASVDEAPDTGRSEAWSPAHLESALETLSRGNPSVIALVDPEHSFGLSTPQVQTLVNHPQWSTRLVAASSDTATLAGAQGITHILPTGGDGAQRRANVLEAVSQRIAQSRVDQGPMPVHYLGSRQALPKIPFSTLLSSNAQFGSFQGNVVLVGRTKAPAVHPLNTPIGPMSPLEVHAHAVSGLVDGMVWEEPRSGTKGLLLLLLIAAWTHRLRKVERPGAIRLSLILSTALVALDWLFFWRGLVLWGPCSAIAGIWLAQFVVVRDSLQQITNKVGYLQTKLAEMLPASIAVKKKVNPAQEDEAFWQDLVDFGRAYVKFDFEGMLAELPEREWHIQIRASTGVSMQQIAEQRRDIRRAPFRAPFLTQKCGWAQNFIHNEKFTKSLVVPLHHESKLMGYWLLHMAQDQAIDDAFMRTCEGIGRQMASVIADTRGQQDSHDDAQANRAQLAMQEVQRDMQRLEQDRRWAMELIDQDREPMMMASLWGPIEMMNQAMRERMKLVFPNGIPDDDIRAVIARLCSGSSNQVQTLMRSAVVDRLSVPIPRGQDEDETFVQGDFSYSLRAIEVGVSDKGPREVPNMQRVRLVLVAKNRLEAPQALQELTPIQSPARLEVLQAPSEAPDIPTEIQEVPVSVPATTPLPAPPVALATTKKSEQPEPVEQEPEEILEPKTLLFKRPQAPEPEPAPKTQPLPQAEVLPEPEEHEEPVIELCEHMPAQEPVLYEDGWEDWTPGEQVRPDEDRSVPHQNHLASAYEH